MRPFPAAAALVAAAPLLLAATNGCGTGDPPVRLAYTSITRPHAGAVASDLTIRAGDLPEFKARAHSFRGQNRYEAVIHVPCRSSAHRGTPPLRPWARATSQKLSAGIGYHALEAFSNVAILPTATAAKLAISRVREMNIACMERNLRQEFGTYRRRIRGVLVQRLASSVSGSDRSVAYQAVVSWRDIPLVLYIDFTYFSYGQDAVSLVTFHSSKPVPPAMDSRLLGLLVERARAHSR